MALSIFKSPNEEPWDRFSHRMNRALDAASVELKGKHRRQLRLGSPVKMSGDRGDTVRVPIVVHGGEREYAIAYLEATEIDRPADQRTVETIAMEAARAAMPYAETPPRKPGDVLFSYP